jgi:hypothetical protein
VEDDSYIALPQFPSTPDGLARLEHLPTVEACIRYWEAVRIHAIQKRSPALERTAMSLRATYEHARQELRKAEPSQNTTTAPAPRVRRARLRTEQSLNEPTKDIREASGK